MAVPSTGQGIYCFDLPEMPVHVQVTPQYDGGSPVVTGDARVFANVAPPACEAPHNDAVVRFRSSSAENPTPQGAFFVSFMFAQP